MNSMSKFINVELQCFISKLKLYIFEKPKRVIGTRALKTLEENCYAKCSELRFRAFLSLRIH